MLTSSGGSINADSCQNLAHVICERSLIVLHLTFMFVCKIPLLAQPLGQARARR